MQCIRLLTFFGVLLSAIREATGQAFQELYDNKWGGLDAWMAFWGEAARRFHLLAGCGLLARLRHSSSLPWKAFEGLRRHPTSDKNPLGGKPQGIHLLILEIG